MANEDTHDDDDDGFEGYGRGRPPTADEKARGVLWVLDEKTAEEVIAEQVDYDEANKVNRLAIAVPQLLPTAWAIFGDIVEAVYLLHSILDDTDTCQSWLRDRASILTQAARYTPKQIDVDTVNIVLKFTNGRHVTFTTSEWGHIEATAPFTEISAE